MPDQRDEKLAEEESQDQDLAVKEPEEPQEDIKPAPESLDDLEDEQDSSIPNIRHSGMSMDTGRQYSVPSQISYNDNSSNRSSGISKMTFLIVGLVILILTGGGLFVLRDRLLGEEEKADESETVIFTKSPTPEPSPSPLLSLDRSKYKIRILNGTTTAGLAASASARLKELGYQIERIGNATNSSFPRTLVRVRGDKSNIVEQLVRDLSPDFDASQGAELKNSDTADGEIILGAK